MIKQTIRVTPAPAAELKTEALPKEIWEMLNHWTPNGFARQDIIRAYWIGKGEQQ